MKRSLVVPLVVILSACGTRASAIEALTRSATNGAIVYTSTCASCHGTDGKGTISGPSMFDTAKNESSEDIIATILNGKAGTQMVSYASLKDQQIADVTAYIKATFVK